MASKNQDPANQNPADALNPGAGANLTDEQRKHREELYGYKRDEEGTLDTSARLEDETAGIPSGSSTTGPDPDTGSQADELNNPDFNNPIDDNNR
ncbi:hypothetical protein KBK19_09980 [Microvirga sp. STR05]|uniref:Uncharacterized protein n=1 Tax=Hymenobacter duratus TaxID=2771356 RepID=A0ABR8JI23_9BACT|nr:hypothetical protein [Hymenobacter duratus]MBD2715363.1 hypothetical protein [Hymenobacter duratus]MBR7950270.1 hypothetical protein [Microvirga sp. STR05]